MDLEGERLAEEETRRQAEARARRDAEEAAAARLREIEQERLRAQDEERRQVELRRREEEARLDAIRVAEIEKAKRIAENDARLKLLAQSHIHEQKLTALAQDESKKKLRVWLALSAAAALAAAVGGTLWVKEAEGRAAVERARLEQAATERRQEFDIEISELSKKLDQLGARDAEKRAAMEDELQRLRKERAQKGHEAGATQPSRLPPPPAAPGGERKPPKRTECSDGDPMCGF